MKIAQLEVFPVAMPYSRVERSSHLERQGTNAIVVKLTTDDGLVGWGESCAQLGDARSMVEAVRSVELFLLGRDPWDRPRIFTDFIRKSMWYRRQTTANFAFQGVDQALWDICGKSAQLPVYQLLGGAYTASVDYFCYLAWDSIDGIVAQCCEGLERGYGVFYLKVGADARAEEEMLAAVRATIGPDKKIRIDANESWNVGTAVKLLLDWDRKYDIDFCEDPVSVDPPGNLLEIRRRVTTPISANAAMMREIDVVRIMQSGCGDVLCFSPYFVGTLARFVAISHVAHQNGWLVCKHAGSELGIAAAAVQHALLAIPNATDGNQQMATTLADDVVTARIPLRDGPRWDRNSSFGLGIDVDAEKLGIYHERFCRDGPFLNYGQLPQSGQED
jgi:L-alanine-DL-glutamate epimerase-like enolase superfamily enzyme